MNDGFVQPAPSKMVPILVGAGVMTATVVIPVFNLVNCLCCAGLMGGAVVGVWMHKKNYPPDMPYTVGNGTIVGLLAGLVAAPVTAILQTLQMGLFTSDFAMTYESQMEEAIRSMEVSGQDPATAEQVRQLMESLGSSPAFFFAMIFVFSLLVFAAFGALGGLIGGNIFKTRIVQVPPQTPGTMS
ncbi:MAG: DUF4199 domain-containing protein [Ignavibacteriae bacterium]|nr:DUF4199 domain-containing protein [Ignavibacteriota bacterium]